MSRHDMITTRQSRQVRRFVADASGTIAASLRARIGDIPTRALGRPVAGDASTSRLVAILGPAPRHDPSRVEQHGQRPLHRRRFCRVDDGQRVSAGSSLARARVLAAFRRDTRGSSAVEFAIVSIPFIFLVLFILQMGIYYMAQASLDAGVIQTADWLVNTYNSGTTPSVDGSSLHTMVYAKSGGMIKNDSTFLVDLRQFGTLTSAPVPIVDGFVDQGSLDSKGVSGSVLALRAQGTITTFMPGFGALATVRSSAIMRRQGS